MSLFLPIGKRLLEERERLGLNQTDFAAIGGVGRKTQFNYESGERAPDGAYLAAIAKAGADALYILTGQRAAGVEPAPALSPEEAALLDNFRHCAKAQQDILKATSAAFAQRPPGQRRA